jgi:hypothetical protein
MSTACFYLQHITALYLSILNLLYSVFLLFQRWLSFSIAYVLMALTGHLFFSYTSYQSLRLYTLYTNMSPSAPTPLIYTAIAPSAPALSTPNLLRYDDDS